MLPHQFLEILKPFFPFDLNYNQQVLLEKLAPFIIQKDKKEVFLLKGYAGTGKSSVMGALVKAQEQLGVKFVLLAPTGRAAKVLSGFSGQQAFTIHKKIYYHKSQGEDRTVYTLQPNNHINTIFIVDEASMIGNNSAAGWGDPFGQRNLLEDLFEYVYAGKSCKLLFVGDSAQLPPVGLDVSPALNEELLRKSFYPEVYSFELTEVVRQAESSGILHNATLLRDGIKNQSAAYPTIDTKFSDIVPLAGDELEDALNSSYSKAGVEGTIILCRSNKRANLYNQQVRARIRWQESEISSGDYMMVVKNNYFWLPPESKAGFIANGDIIEVLKVNKIEEMYGFRFANIRFRMVDYPDEKELEAKIILSTIMSESPALPYEESRKLYDSVMADYLYISQKSKRYKELKQNPYYNALQVKFSYAVTCHKAQGGQWENVFIEHGYLTDEMLNTEFLRWLYTGFTRATKKLYLVNFSGKFFG